MNPQTPSEPNGTALQLRHAGMTWNVVSHFDTAPAVAPPSQVTPATDRASSSAMGTALMRAAHARLDPQPLIEDAWGERLVPEAALTAIREAATARARAEGRTLMLPPQTLLDSAIVGGSAFANVILRSRYCEDALRAAIGRGAQQYVIIGAGFDSFALRAPAYAAGVQVFEIDRAATQTLKRRRLAECGVPVPPHLHFVGADLSTESLDSSLGRSRFRPGAPTFFSWLGVTMFLSRPACLSTLEAVAASGGVGSELVFTYFDERIFEVRSERFRNMQAYLQSVGEPLCGSFAPAALRADLDAAGFDLLEDVADAELLARYGRAGDKTLVPLEHSRIALARVR